MSSHREAPEISKDPTADNTDVYAFVDQTDPTKVNLIANFNPFEIPYGGPNFSEFADDVVYTINVANQGTALADISFQFRFTTTIRNPNTFLYNVGPITSISSTNWNRPQTFSVTKVVRNPSNGAFTSTVLGTKLLVPPCNVGERSTPNYQAAYGAASVQALGTGRKVFAGQRSDPFFVDLGSVFDLAGLRPLNQAHLIKLPTLTGLDGLQGLNVHTIALQVPIAELAIGGVKPTNPLSSNSVIGVWSSTYRSRGRLFDSTTGTYKPFGDAVQVSRLANPLFNEVINPMSVKDKWNSLPPSADSAFTKYVNTSELAGLLPVLYPGAFPNLAKFNASGQPRTDLNAILMTGIPGSVLKAFTTYTGSVQADLLRLNLAVPPTPAAKANPLGVLYGDNAGFPNGRRVIDDVTTIELRAIAGLTLPLTYPAYKPDGILAGDAIRDGSSNTNLPLPTAFPYVAVPANGYDSSPGTPSVTLSQAK
ncbi:DUF4331 domain-containing protein [Nakamurella sp. PAMC28650]|uniref:DUF4331 domain-containing protein n=1 Tax=Nakamurella sp. PAMC28650 TaxID=2762325 RepID=UPI00164EB207|nr:DUF4331 domain-containing protein [Nakamurella sp. PAMC28650]QNK80293.1 DUF4331 domain-containing protein [Nakamurella sp. PAMC28650]